MEINEVDDEGPPWNPKHEGIPPTWKRIGDGGNAHVWTDGTHAIKRLKPNASKEPVARFAREAQLFIEIASDSELAIVPVLAVRRRAGEIEIVMDRLGGNLAEVIGEFAGNPQKSAAALLPIVETLAKLAERSPPIHHRDIKPENLLYWRREGSIALALTDFGCAYLAEDERLTPTHRAIGAWAYRPPEYSIGRVAAVDEKGDVFSLGKVLWAMINGERHVVFPGPVWFLDEFDLENRYPNASRINQAMIVIAQACDIRPDRRPSLVQIAENLRWLISLEAGEGSLIDNDLTAAMLRKEAQREIEYQQRRAFAAQFVSAIHADFLTAINALHSRLPESTLFREWFNTTHRLGQPRQALVDQVAVLESDAPVSNVRFQKTSLITRFFPADAKTPIYFIAQVEDENDRVPASKLTVLGYPEGVRVKILYSDGNIVDEPYQSSVLVDFFARAATMLP